MTQGKNPTELLAALDKLYTSSPLMKQYVDVHLVYDPFDRQFNMWRNVAKFFARTEVRPLLSPFSPSSTSLAQTLTPSDLLQYVMMLDVDFWLCTDFRSRMLDSPEIMQRLKGGMAAFVVPAFEFHKQSDGVDPLTFPSTKEVRPSSPSSPCLSPATERELTSSLVDDLQDLVQLVRDDKIGMFHKSWAPGHGSTNYTRYYDAKPGEVYRVHGYTHSYEPYVIFKKEGTPWWVLLVPVSSSSRLPPCTTDELILALRRVCRCDERFIGYGGNKAACLFELYLSGVSFYVLPDDFLIHQSHAYAEKARKHERKYNRKLYTDFREELCFRYLNLFLDQIESPRAKVRARSLRPSSPLAPPRAPGSTCDWWKCADAAAVPRRTSPSSARRSRASARRRRATLLRPVASSRLPSAHDRRSPSFAPAWPTWSSRPHLEAPTLAVLRLAHAPSPFLGVLLVLLHHPRPYISPCPYPLRVVPLLASFVVVVGAVRRRPPSYPPAPSLLGLAPSFLSSLPPPCATMLSRRQTRLCARRDTLFHPSARRTTLLVRSSLSLGLRSMRAWSRERGFYLGREKDRISMKGKQGTGRCRDPSLSLSRERRRQVPGGESEGPSSTALSLARQWDSHGARSSTSAPSTERTSLRPRSPRQLHRPPPAPSPRSAFTATPALCEKPTPRRAASRASQDAHTSRTRRRSARRRRQPSSPHGVPRLARPRSHSSQSRS